MTFLERRQDRHTYIEILERHFLKKVKKSVILLYSLTNQWLNLLCKKTQRRGKLYTRLINKMTFPHLIGRVTVLTNV